MNKIKKKAVTSLLIGFFIITALFIAGCAKAPTEEINSTTDVVEAAKQAGAEKYLPDDAKRVSDELSVALDEVKTQDGKFALFRKYDKAKEMLASVKSNAEKLKTDTAAKKEEVKNNAISAMGEAKNAINNAKTMLENAPAGKETQADIEVMKGDVKGLEDSLPGVQSAIDSEDYDGAINTAKSIKEKADGVTSQVQQAIEKIEAAKKAREEAKKMKNKKTKK